MSNELKIERVVDGVSVQQGTNYTAYLRSGLTKQDLLAFFNSIYGNLRYQQNSSNVFGLLARDLWQRVGNLPNNLNYTSVILTSTACGESGGSVVPSTSFDSGYIGYVNTDTGYSGTETDRGTINLSESVFYSPYKAKLVIDLPTHACNGNIKTILIGKRPIGENTGINQSKTSLEKHAVGVSRFTTGEYLDPTRVWYKDWVITYARQSTITYPTYIDTKFAKITSDSTGQIYTGPTLDGVSYLTQFNNEIYARVKPETDKISLADAREKVVYKKVIITELGGELLDIKLSDEEYRPLANIPNITELTGTYIFSCIGHLGHLVIYACEGSRVDSNGYVNVFGINKNDTYSHLYRTGNYCTSVPACLYYEGDDLIFSDRTLISSASSPGLGFRIASESIKTNSAPKQYPIKARSGNAQYTSYQVASQSYVNLYGIYVPDEPVIAFELTESIVKTDKEVVKITLDIDLSIG